MIRLLLLLLFPVMAQAQDTIRIASYNAELSRDGPGLLLRDIQGGRDPQISAVIRVIAQASPDILAIQGIDWDYDARALSALADRLAQAGAPYPYRLSLRPNSGLMTELDLDGDGRRNGPGDAQGFGRFSGQSGIAVLSRYPIDRDAVRDFSGLLWRDLPGAHLPQRNNAPFPSVEAQALQRLSSTGHWVVPITLPDGPLHLLTYQAGPPNFDGPEDRNGLRNRDETRLWQVFLGAGLGPAPTDRFVIAGGSNLDPAKGDGHSGTMQELLNDPRLQDPQPTSLEAGENTVEWQSAGRLRVDYVLPSADWRIVETGVFWPKPDSPFHSIVTQASRHRLVWVDLNLN